MTCQAPEHPRSNGALSRLRFWPVIDPRQSFTHKRGAVSLGKAVGNAERFDTLLIGQQSNCSGPIGAPHAAGKAESLENARHRGIRVCIILVPEPPFFGRSVVHDPKILRKQATKMPCLDEAVIEPEAIEQLRLWTVEAAEEAGEVQRAANAGLASDPAARSKAALVRVRKVGSRLASTENCSITREGALWLTSGVQTGHGVRSRYFVTFDQKHAAVRG